MLNSFRHLKKHKQILKQVQYDDTYQLYLRHAEFISAFQKLIKKNHYLCLKDLMSKPITDISQLDLSKQYTYTDYLLWQFSDRVELIKGWVYKMTPAPRRKHQTVSLNFEYKLETFIRNKKQKCNLFHAPFDVRLIKNKGKQNEITTVVQPDISIICDKTKLDDAGCLGAPDMIIEILSPSTAKKDYNEKFNLYEENQVKEYWIVNPDAKSIEVFLLDKKDKYQSLGIYNELDGFTEVPVNIFSKLTLQLKEIFEE